MILDVKRFFFFFLWLLYKETLGSTAKEAGSECTPGTLDGERVGFLSIRNSRCSVNWRHRWQYAANKSLFIAALVHPGAGTG